MTILHGYVSTATVNTALILRNQIVFAKFCLPYLSEAEGGHILDLGCGKGRDSLSFICLLRLSRFLPVFQTGGRKNLPPTCA